MNLQARHTGKLINCHVVRQAQRSTLDESLRLGQFWMKMAQTWKGGPDEKVYRARGYAFLARACELEQRIEIAYSPIDSLSDMPRRVMIHRRAL